MSVEQQRRARIDEARELVGTTEVSRRTAWGLALALVTTLLGGLALDLGAQLERWLGFGSATAQTRRVTVNEGWRAGNHHLLAAVRELEEGLEEDSVLRELLTGPSHTVLATLGSGSHQVLPGRDGHLVFRPDYEQVTGPPFLDPGVLRRRQRQSDSWRPPPQPDPRPALLRLRRDLADRGIELVLLPAPSKPAAMPETLARLHSIGEPLPTPVNPSDSALFAELRAQGVRVVEPPDGSFLRADSHWRPELVERTAALLAAEVAPLLDDDPTKPPPRYRREARRVDGVGDLARLLTLPPDHPWMQPETVITRRVLTMPDDTPWQPDPAAPVLLLGDSFTNVFSQPALGWGDGAGLAEQLAFHLQRPVDRIAVDAGGDLEVRQRLARLPARRLAGKKLVVYQFARRNLSVGDWQVVPLPPPSEISPDDDAISPLDEDSEGAIETLVTLLTVADAPPLDDTPYRHALLAARARLQDGSEGPETPTEMLVYGYLLRDAEPGPAARWRPGGELRLRLTPWSTVAADLDALQRHELPGFDWLDLPVYLAEPP